MWTLKYKETSPYIYSTRSSSIRYSYNSKPLNFPRHWHDPFEILLIDDGEIEITVEKEKYIAKKDDLVLIPPGYEHSGICMNDNCRYHMIQFSADNLMTSTAASDFFLKPLASKKQPFNFKIIIQDSKINLLTHILCKSRQQGNLNPLEQLGNLFILISALFENNHISIKSEHITPSSAFSDVIAYTNEHFIEDISTKSIASKFGYTESYFCRRFKEITGLSFSNYVLKSRLDYACKLLSSSSISISDACETSGFKSFSYFSTMFKKQYGYTPSEYKKISIDFKTINKTNE